MVDTSRVSSLHTVSISQRSLVHGITLFGFALIAVGIFLPWVDETQARVYVLGMEAGFERQWGKRLLLGAAVGAVLVVLSFRSRNRWNVAGPVLSAIGTATVIIVAVTTPLTGQWSPEIGVYVTLFGGFLVTTAPLASLINTHLRSS